MTAPTKAGTSRKTESTAANVRSLSSEDLGESEPAHSRARAATVITAAAPSRLQATARGLNFFALLLSVPPWVVGPILRRTGAPDKGLRLGGADGRPPASLKQDDGKADQDPTRDLKRPQGLGQQHPREQGR